MLSSQRFIARSTLESISSIRRRRTDSHSEESVGRAIAGRRERAIVATKVGLEWDERGVLKYFPRPGEIDDCRFVSQDDCYLHNTTFRKRNRVCDIGGSQCRSDQGCTNSGPRSRRLRHVRPNDDSSGVAPF
jgi:hypothetical protein